MFKSPRRSLLFVPGSSIKMMNKSIGSNADSIILDLEDAVSLNEKDIARKNVKEFISKFKEKNIEIIIRINELNTRFGMLDIEDIAREEPDAILIPKANENIINSADVLLESIELRHNLESKSLKIIPLVETSESINNISNLLNSSSRITALLFGAEDLTSEIGIVRNVDSKFLDYARNTISLAGHQHKIDLIDTPFTNFSDNEELKKDSYDAQQIGFTGKACIHPKQIETVNEIFSPVEEDVRKAEELVCAFEKSIDDGKGAFTFEGKMVDLPIAEKARKLLDKAEAIKNYRK